MRRPKGFGRNYFQLTAIQATVTAVTIHAITIATQLLSHPLSSTEADEGDPNDPLLSLLSPLTITSEPDSRPQLRSCHCNCYFKRKTRNIFISLYTKFKPRYYCPHRVSGISPPLPLYQHLMNYHKLIQIKMGIDTN